MQMFENHCIFAFALKFLSPGLCIQLLGNTANYKIRIVLE